MKLYIKNNGKILGPLDWDRILALHDKGRFSSDVTVSEDKNNWLTVEQVMQVTGQDSGTSAQSSSLSTAGNPSLPQSRLRLQQEGDQQPDYIVPQHPDVPHFQQTDNIISQEIGIQQYQQIDVQQNVSNSNNILKYILLSAGIIIVGFASWYYFIHKDYFIKKKNISTTEQKKIDRVSISGEYASRISETMLKFKRSNSATSNVNAQIANGANYTFFMLWILADQKGCQISNIISKGEQEMHKSDNFYHITLNGIYRTVEILNVIAMSMGCSTSGIMNQFSHQDTIADNVFQQICNGTYRTVELLDCIATKKGCSTSSIMSNFKHQDSVADNINQQICNGTYRTVELLDIIARDMGCSTSDIMSNFKYQDTVTDNVNQQICNGTHHTVELLNLIVGKIDE